MTTYIICFELKEEETKKEIIRKINAYGSCQMVLHNVYAVATDKKAAEIRDELLELMKRGEYVFVIKSGYEAAWSVEGGKSASEWLKSNL